MSQIGEKVKVLVFCVRVSLKAVRTGQMMVTRSIVMLVEVEKSG